MTVRRTVAAVAGLVVVAVAVLVLGSAMGDTGRNRVRSPLEGRQAPALAGTTLDGHHYELKPRPGTVTVVNIWASWCGPCRDELPLLVHSVGDWSHRGVRLVTIDTKDGPVAARTLLQEVKAKDLLAVQDPEGRLAVSWGATGVPETVVLDEHGVVRARWLGQVSAGWLDRQLRRWAPA
jgi:cytochrome c biogenesis protein CcmG, thiol:disulfide interchange protein DsbE